MLEHLKLHHIGFVVSDVERAMPGFVQSLDGKWDRRIWEDPHQGVRVAFVHVGGTPAQIELVSPLSEDSPVARFLERGGGLHHLCYEVTELDMCVQAMRRLGNLLVRAPVPAVAFEGRRIAWVITREQLLLELLEN